MSAFFHVNKVDKLINDTYPECEFQDYLLYKKDMLLDIILQLAKVVTQEQIDAALNHVLDEYKKLLPTYKAPSDS